MPVFSYVRAMADYAIGHEDEFTKIELDILHDHCEGMTKAQIVEKYKDLTENPSRVLYKVEWKLRQLQRKESRRLSQSQN